MVVRQRFNFFLLLFIFWWTSSSAQPLQSQSFFQYQRFDELNDSISDAVYPSLSQTDTLNLFPAYSGWKANTFIGRKAFNESLFQITKPDYSIRIDPLVEFSLGSDNDISTYQNTRGFSLRIKLKEKLYIHSWFQENQARLPVYLNEFATLKRIVPGNGIVRSFGEGGWDYAQSGGIIELDLKPYFNVQAGHGSNFIGEGYRSVFLSDQAFNYPYLKLQSTLWKFRYTNIYMSLQDIRKDRRLGDLHAKKYASMHYLSWQATPKLNIGIFEAVVVQDSTGTRGLDVNYWNPVIFFRPVDFSLGSPDNMLLGASASYEFTKGAMVYGQFLLDEFTLDEVVADSGYWANKWAWQIGAKYEIREDNYWMRFRLEANSAMPYMYSARYTLQNYAHYNEGLAHPLGSNFTETLFRAEGAYKRWTGSLHISSSIRGVDSANVNLGSDIYKSYGTRFQDYGNEKHQGVQEQRMIVGLDVAYTINPEMNLQVFSSYLYRTEHLDDVLSSETNWFYLGLRTQLFNKKQLF